MTRVTPVDASRSSRAWSWRALVAAGVLLTGSVAEATPVAATPPTRLLDREAAFALSLSPRALQADADLVRAGLALWSTPAAFADTSRTSLGVDVIDPRSFARTGLEPAGPVLISAFAIDRVEVETAYRSAMQALGRRDWRGLRQLPPVWYRHRLVARIADPLRLAAFLGEQRLSPLTALTAAGLETMLGLDRTAAAALTGRLRGAGAVGVGRLPGDGLVLVRVLEGTLLVVDLVQPWLGATPPAARQAALLARLAAPPPPGTPAPSGAWRLLERDAAVVLHVDGRRLQDLAQVTARERALARMPRLAPPARPPALAAVEAEVVACRDGFERAAARATLNDGAFALRTGPGHLTVDLAWTLGPGRAEAFATHDDRLVSLPGPVPVPLALLALRLDLRGFAGRVTRDGPLIRRLGDATRFIVSCGPLTELLAIVRYWPELLALALEEAHRERDAGRIVAGLHNLVLGLASLAGDEPRVFALASLETDAATRLEQLAQAGRTPVRLRRGRLESGRVLMMAASDEATLATARALGARRPPLAARPPLEVQLDLPALWRTLAGDQSPAEAAARRYLADHLGLLRGTLAVESDALVGELRVERR